jgi:hypothetical protein
MEIIMESSPPHKTSPKANPIKATSGKRGRPPNTRNKLTMASIERAQASGDGRLPHELLLEIARNGVIEVNLGLASYYEGAGGKIIKIKKKDKMSNVEGEKAFLVVPTDMRLYALRSAAPYFSPKKLSVDGVKPPDLYAVFDPRIIVAMAKEDRIILEKALVGDISTESPVDPADYEALMLEGERGIRK